MSTTRLQEVLVAFGKGKQADIAAPQLSAALWRFSKLNAALARAKGEADAANISKTRFVAAASHDILQPLNAARLYVTSLIERGSRDTWTPTPHRVLATDGTGPRDPKLRDPRGYILPADQPDFLTATRFVNTLIKNGVTVERATRDFQVAGKSYPAGSYVVSAWPCLASTPLALVREAVFTSANMVPR